MRMTMESQSHAMLVTYKYDVYTKWLHIWKYFGLNVYQFYELFHERKTWCNAHGLEYDKKNDEMFQCTEKISIYFVIFDFDSRIFGKPISFLGHSPDPMHAITIRLSYLIKCWTVPSARKMRPLSFVLLAWVTTCECLMRPTQINNNHAKASSQKAHKREKSHMICVHASTPLTDTHQLVRQQSDGNDHG